MNEKMRTTISLDKSLYKLAKELAGSDERSFNSLVSKLLREYVESKGSK